MLKLNNQASVPLYYLMPINVARILWEIL